MLLSPLADRLVPAAPLADPPSPIVSDLAELRLLRASQQAIEQIGAGVEWPAALHDLAALIGFAVLGDARHALVAVLRCVDAERAIVRI